MSIVPVALAEEDVSSEDTEVVSEDLIEESEVVDKINSKEMRKKAKLRAHKFKKDLLNVREGALKAKKNFLQAKQKHLDHKIKLNKLKKQVKDCGEDNENCQEKKLDFRRGLKNHMLKGIEVMEKSLERVSSKVENSKRIGDDEKRDLLFELEELQNEISSEKENVEILNEDSTAEELRKELKQVKELWKKVKKTQKRVVSFLMNSKLGKLVDKHDEFLNGMKMRIDNLAEQGADVAELERLLANFKEHVDEVNSDYARAKNLWNDIATGSESVDAWHKAHKEVRKDLHETKKLLRQFIGKYKEVKNSLDSE